MMLIIQTFAILHLLDLKTVDVLGCIISSNVLTFESVNLTIRFVLLEEKTNLDLCPCQIYILTKKLKTLNKMPQLFSQFTKPITHDNLHASLRSSYRLGTVGVIS